MYHFIDDEKWWYPTFWEATKKQSTRAFVKGRDNMMLDDLFARYSNRPESFAWIEKITYDADNGIKVHTYEEDIVAEDLCELTGGIYCKQ